MRLYFEYRNSCNNKAIPLALLDKIVAKFFGGTPDEKEYYIFPEGDEEVSWLDVIQGLVWLPDLVHWHNRVEMDELVRQLKENGSMCQPDNIKPFIDLLHYFQHLNLYFYYYFTYQSMFDPYDKNASYMTTDPRMKYTEEEVDEILKYVVGRDSFVKEYNIRKLLPATSGIVPESFDDFMSKIENRLSETIKKEIGFNRYNLDKTKELLYRGFPLDLAKIFSPLIYLEMVNSGEGDYHGFRRKEMGIDNINQYMDRQRTYALRYKDCNSDTEKELLRKEIETELLEKCISMIHN